MSTSQYDAEINLWISGSPEGYIARMHSSKVPNVSALLVHATTLENHFLLWEQSNVENKGRLFGVVHRSNPEEAEQYLYKRAQKFVSGRNVEDKTKYTTEPIAPST